MKICFVDTTKLQYSSKDLYNEKIRGGESSIINLSKKLSENDNEVYVFNNSRVEINEKNYNWLNINRIKHFENNFDAVISNNDTKILNKFKCNKKYVLSHSILTIEKAFRKKQLLSYFKNKPKYLLLGNYHRDRMSKLFSIFGSHIINYGVDEIFENKVLDNNIDKNLSYFTSRQDRNLDLLIDIWQNGIFKKRKESKLFITPISKNLTEYNIFNRNMLNREKFIDEIIKARMIILPGHKAELFCIAALEALELCIPIVTMGIGSLSERLDHGITGLVSKNKTDFLNNIIELYTNDALWNEIRNNLKQKRGSYSWNVAAIKFLEILKK